MGHQTGSWADVVEIARRWWWMPLGAGGWIVVGALGFSSARIGVATTLGISISAQLSVCVAIDSTDYWPGATATLGFVCIGVGVALVATSP